MIRAVLAAALALVPQVAPADERIDEIVGAAAEHAIWRAFDQALLKGESAHEFALLGMTQGENALDVERLLDIAALRLLAAEQGGAAAPWLERQGMDVEAARRLICAVADAGPGRAHAMIARWGLPENRPMSCGEDLGDRLRRLEPWFYAAANGSPATIAARYGPGTWRGWLSERELLEEIAEMLAALFPFADGMALAAGPCGAAEMRWTPETRTITLCYELLDAFAALAEAVDKP